jgi:O-antigen ligase
MFPHMTPSLPKRFEPLISRFVQSVIPDAPITWENLIFVASIALLPLFYLTVKNWTETFLVILAVISVFGIWKSRLTLKSLLPDRATTWIFLALTFPIVAVALTILMRGDLHWKLLTQNLDLLNGPIRLVFAGIAFLWMRHRRVQFLTIFNVSCGLSILITLPFAHTMQPGLPDRYTTSLIDLDEFSQQICALGLIQFAFLVFRPPSSRLFFALNVIIILIAVKLALSSGGRGGWIAIPPVLLVISALYKGSRKRLFTGVLVIILAAALLIGFNKSFRERTSSIYSQTISWFEGSNDPLSGGSGRLSMWTISWQLIKQKPLVGYGSKLNFWDPVYHMDPSLYLRKGVSYESEEPIRNCLCEVGEHNQYLSDNLLNGFLGFLSRVLILAIPIIVFTRAKKNGPTAFQASCVGICFICSFIIFGITQGPFSYKFICSFYGFAIAGFAAALISSESHRTISCNVT